MQSPASTTVGQRSHGLFWTLFNAIRNVGDVVLAMSQALTSTMQKCQAGMDKIAKDMKKTSAQTESDNKKAEIRATTQ